MSTSHGYTIVYIYDDDMIITYDGISWIIELKLQLGKQFLSKNWVDFGLKLSIFLGDIFISI